MTRLRLGSFCSGYGGLDLAVAHLDHTPENCDPDNLRAMCQACHLTYDAAHHAATRARTLHAQQIAGMSPLFDLDEQGR